MNPAIPDPRFIPTQAMTTEMKVSIDNETFELVPHFCVHGLSFLCSWPELG